MGNEVVINATGHELDKLVNDTDWNIRREVAIRGRDKDLDILVNDKELMVRKAVARHGRDKDLNLLVRDNDHEVRFEVAKKGRDKDLDILVYDEYAIVRKEVAKHGRDKDLEILKSDKATTVRKEALKQLEKKAEETKPVSVEPKVESVVEPVTIEEPIIEQEEYTQVESVQEPIVRETETLVDAEYDTFTFEDIDNIVDGKPIEPKEPIKEDINEIPENDINEYVEDTELNETPIDKKPSFKTKVSNLFSKLIKKGK